MGKDYIGHKNSSITLVAYARYIKSKEKKRGSFLENELYSKIELKDSE